MVLKGLAFGGAIAAVAIAVFAALVLRPAAPAPGLTVESGQPGTMVVMPNGMAAPQLQLSQPGSAPALVNETGPGSLVGLSRDNAETLKLAAEGSGAAAAAAEEQLVAGCGGK